MSSRAERMGSAMAREFQGTFISEERSEIVDPQTDFQVQTEASDEE